MTEDLKSQIRYVFGRKVGSALIGHLMSFETPPGEDWFVQSTPEGWLIYKDNANNYFARMAGRGNQPLVEIHRNRLQVVTRRTVADLLKRLEEEKQP